MPKPQLVTITVLHHLHDLALNGFHDDMCQLLITSMESDPRTSQQLEHRLAVNQGIRNPAPPTTQEDTHSSEHPQHQPHCSAVQTTRTRLHHARSLSTMHHYFEDQIVQSNSMKQTTTANKTRTPANLITNNKYFHFQISSSCCHVTNIV